MKFIVFLAAAEPTGRYPLWRALLDEAAPALHGRGLHCTVNRILGPGPQPIWDVVLELWADDAVALAGLSLGRLVPDGRMLVCAVEELVEKDELGSVSARPTPAVKLIVPWQRRLDISADEVRRRWDQHVPLANRVHVGCVRYVRHWVLSLDDQGIGALPSYQGIAMQHFRSQDDFEQRMFDTPDDAQLIHADVGRFLADFDSLIAEEHRFAASGR